MTKQEFLESLRTALTGRVSPSAVEENIRYYTDYINTQIRMGKSEEQVISELGDPRLLARSIADADKRADRSHLDEGAQTGSRQNTAAGNGYGMGGRTYRMPVWLVLLLIGLIFILILSIVFSVLSFLAPLILPILLIVLVFRLLSRRQ